MKGALESLTQAVRIDPKNLAANYQIGLLHFHTGEQLWASGRYNATVYVISTVTGQVLARIRVGAQDHGLTYFPNVGLHSIGHNGVYR